MQRVRFARFRRLLFIGPGLSLSLIGSFAFGQSAMPLLEGLKKLNQKRGVYFLYDPQLVEGRTVTASLDWKATSDQLLTQLLVGTNLSYRKVSDCYLIEPQSLPPINASPVSLLKRRFTISGFVRERNSGEQLVGATVFIAGKTGTSTNNYGFYALSLPESDEVEIIISLVGYQRAYRRVRLDGNVTLDVDLTNNDLLDEVVLKSDATEQAWSTPQTSQHTMPTASVRNTPAAAGEKDVLKTLQLLPGIQKGLDGQVGLHVRGGGTDQNLLILDEAPVYNANHLFGFFSAFNVDALKSIRLQKGGFSARYGGRLSSVVEMNMREGNKQRFHGEVGTGLVASRLIMEGPIVQNKASFLLTARRTNFDRLLGNFIANLADNYTGTDWRANFHDLNAKINVSLNHRNQLYISGYSGRDNFGGGGSLDTNRRWENHMQWGNTTSTLRWNHLFNERLFANLSFIYSRYNFTTYTKYIPIDPSVPNTVANTWRYFNRLTDYTLKYDLDFFPSLTHQLNAGISTTQRLFRLNGSEVSSRDHTSMYMESIRSVETSLYAEDNWEIGKRLKLAIGSRATLYQAEKTPYFRVEPRISASVKLNAQTALRGSFADMNQFVHQLTNTGQGLPTDLWVPASAHVKPQHSRQVVVGVVHDLTPKWQLTVEAYRKWMRHIIGYHPDADFIGLTNAQDAQQVRWQDNVTSGYADASGVEVLLQRKVGRLSGWIAYTWAITRWRFPALNDGQAFYPTHDRRHTLSWIGTYELKPSCKLSASWSYGSGSPQPLWMSGRLGSGPLASGKAGNSSGQTEPAGVRNQTQQLPIDFRGAPLHQLDVSLQKTFTRGRFNHVLEATVTNAYGRRNPFYYRLEVDKGNQSIVRRVSLFSFIPSISYTLRF